MQKFDKLEGIAAPMDIINIDTDMIIPKQFLKSIKKSGFGPNLFDAWRYEDEGYPGQDVSERSINKDYVHIQSKDQQFDIKEASRKYCIVNDEFNIEIQHV